MDYNRTSYRDANVGESYSTAPRVNSSHLRNTYSKIVQLADNLNFNTPVFDGMLKRNRSLGSVQAFIVELALSDERFVEENLKPFCIAEGMNLMLGKHYQDGTYFDRLETYNARKKRRAAQLDPLPAAPAKRVRKPNRSYWREEN